MTARRMAMMLVGVLALSVVTAAQSKGKTKAQGKVVDEAGQPLGEVIVAAVMEGQDKPFQQAKTNNKGEWSVQNLVAGKWKFYFGGKQGLERRASTPTSARAARSRCPMSSSRSPLIMTR